MRQLITLAKPITVQLQRPTNVTDHFQQKVSVLRIVRPDVCIKMTADSRGFIEVVVDGVIPFDSKSDTLWDLNEFGGSQTIEIRFASITSTTPAVGDVLPPAERVSESIYFSGKRTK